MRKEYTTRKQNWKTCYMSRPLMAVAYRRPTCNQLNPLKSEDTSDFAAIEKEEAKEASLH